MRLTGSPNWRWRMRLSWRTGDSGPLAVACIVAAVILSWLPSTIMVPQLRTGSETPVSTALVVAGVLGIAIQGSLVEPSPHIHVMGVGLRRWSGAARAALLALSFVAMLAAVAPLHLASGSVVVLTMTGEATLCGWACGHRLAWLLPGTHAAAAALLGATALHTFEWWAWPADPEPTMSTLIVSLVVLAAGLVAETVRPRTWLVVWGADEG